ncbi:uncharacterized protein LOC142344873 isoform X2 [Convolutriloba macropyga]|uniref:uncharacterized protein LOC142344873 isoform X2 n=1 Tax=Convolutriloba macropyga TaxID=536237 RepID=UPI003F521835
MGFTGFIWRLALVLSVFSGTVAASDYSDYDYDYDYDYEDDYVPWDYDEDYDYYNYEPDEPEEIEWVALPEEVMSSETIFASEYAMAHIPQMAKELKKLDCNLAGGFIKQIYSNVKGSDDVMIQVECAGVTSYITMPNNMTASDVIMEVTNETPKGIGTISDIMPDTVSPIQNIDYDDYDYEDYDYSDYDDIIPIAENDYPEDYDYDDYDHDYYCNYYPADCYLDSDDYATDEFDYDEDDYDYATGRFDYGEQDYGYVTDDFDYDDYDYGYVTDEFDYEDYDYGYVTDDYNFSDSEIDSDEKDYNYIDYYSWWDRLYMVNDYDYDYDIDHLYNVTDDIDVGDYDYENGYLDYDYAYGHDYNRYDDYDYNYEEAESTDADEKVLKWTPIPLTELGQFEEFLERSLFELPELKSELHKLGCPDPVQSLETGDHFLVQIYGNQFHYQDQLFEVHCNGVTSFIRYFGSPFAEPVVSSSSEKPTNVIEEYKPEVWEEIEDSLSFDSGMKRDGAETETEDEDVSWEQLPQEELDDHIHLLEQALFLSARLSPELVKLGCPEPDFEADYEDPGSYLIAAYGNRKNQIDQLFEVNCDGKTSFIRYMKEYDGRYYVKTTTEKPTNVVELKRGEMFPWVWKKNDESFDKRATTLFQNFQGYMKKRHDEQNNPTKGSGKENEWLAIPWDSLHYTREYVLYELFFYGLNTTLQSIGCDLSHNGFLKEIYLNKLNPFDELVEVECGGEKSYFRIYNPPSEKEPILGVYTEKPTWVIGEYKGREPDSTDYEFDHDLGYDKIYDDGFKLQSYEDYKNLLTSLFYLQGGFKVTALDDEGYLSVAWVQIPLTELAHKLSVIEDSMKSNDAVFNSLSKLGCRNDSANFLQKFYGNLMNPKDTLYEVKCDGQKNSFIRGYGYPIVDSEIYEDIPTVPLGNAHFVHPPKEVEWLPLPSKTIGGEDTLKVASQALFRLFEAQMLQHGCQKDGNVVRKFFGNRYDALDFLFEIYCNGETSFVRVYGDIDDDDDKDINYNFTKEKPMNFLEPLSHENSSSINVPNSDENSKINWTFDQTYNSFDAVESTEKNLFENPVTRNFLEDLGCVEGGMFIRRVLKHGGDPMDKLFEVYCSGKVSYLRVYGQPVMVLKYHVDVSDKMPTQPFWKNIKSNNDQSQLGLDQLFSDADKRSPASRDFSSIGQIGLPEQVHWYPLPRDQQDGGSFDSTVQILLDIPKIQSEIHKVGCENDEDFVQEIYLNPIHPLDGLVEVFCRGETSYVRVLVDPDDIENPDVYVSEAKPTNVLEKFEWNGYPDMASEDETMNGYEDDVKRAAENDNHTQDSLDEQIQNGLPDQLQWFPVPHEQLPGGNLDAVQQLMFQVPKLHSEVNKLGCEKSNDFVQEIYRNAFHPLDALVEVFCNSQTSYVRVFGNPTEDADFEIYVSKQKPTNVLKSFDWNHYPDYFADDDESSDYKTNFAGDVDADTKIEWTTDYQLSSVESTQAAERKLFQVPATREVVEDLGCEEGSMYVRQVFGHPYHPLDKLVEVYCGGQTSYIRIYGNPEELGRKYRLEVSDEKPTDVITDLEWSNMPDDFLEPVKRTTEWNNPDLNPDVVEWVKIPHHNFEGNMLKGIQQIMIQYPRIRDQIVQLGCNYQSDFVQEVYQNFNDHNDMLFEISCGHETSFLRVYGDPTKIGDEFLLETSKEKPENPISGVTFDYTSDEGPEDYNIHEESQSSASTDGIRWYYDFALNSADARMYVEDKLFEVPETRNILNQLGCDEGTLFIDVISGQPRNRQDFLIELNCGHEKTYLRICGNPVSGQDYRIEVSKEIPTQLIEDLSWDKEPDEFFDYVPQRKRRSDEHTTLSDDEDWKPVPFNHLPASRFEIEQNMFNTHGMKKDLQDIGCSLKQHFLREVYLSDTVKNGAIAKVKCSGEIYFLSWFVHASDGRLEVKVTDQFPTESFGTMFPE